MAPVRFADSIETLRNRGDEVLLELARVLSSLHWSRARSGTPSRCRACSRRAMTSSRCSNLSLRSTRKAPASTGAHSTDPSQAAGLRCRRIRSSASVTGSRRRARLRRPRRPYRGSFWAPRFHRRRISRTRSSGKSTPIADGALTFSATSSSAARSGRLRRRCNSRSKPPARPTAATAAASPRSSSSRRCAPMMPPPSTCRSS